MTNCARGQTSSLKFFSLARSLGVKIFQLMKTAFSWRLVSSMATTGTYLKKTRSNCRRTLRILTMRVSSSSLVPSTSTLAVNPFKDGKFNFKFWIIPFSLQAKTSNKRLASWPIWQTWHYCLRRCEPTKWNWVLWYWMPNVASNDRLERRVIQFLPWWSP